jgi:hypothetical protein
VEIPGGDNLTRRYERTMSRLEQIMQAGYKVVTQWECEWDRAKFTDQKRELLTHPTVSCSPLRTRDALYSGRTEGMCLHRVARDDETIKYVDVMSLYPYICKYYKIPVDHPKVHVGDACNDIDRCINMEGMIKCELLPSKDLYHPVLPFRHDHKLLIFLCRSCVSQHNFSDKFGHVSDRENAFTGTWMIDEMRLAVQKGYRIREIFEVYEYAVTQYDPQTGDGGLFVRYINTFLKLKSQASGYPGWVRTPDDEDRYVQAFWDCEGICLDKNLMSHNAI